MRHRQLDLAVGGGNRAYDRGSALCGGCGGSLEVTIETNGNGGLVDVVTPCKNCRVSRIRIKPAPPQALARLSPEERARRRRERQTRRQAERRAANPTTTRQCKTCGQPFEWRRKPGRPSDYCDTCN